jgi:hypothetical protein
MGLEDNDELYESIQVSRVMVKTKSTSRVDLLGSSTYGLALLFVSHAAPTLIVLTPQRTVRRAAIQAGIDLHSVLRDIPVEKLANVFKKASAFRPFHS